VKVSALVLTFNHERSIASALESALMQETDFDFEIVVSEDCSTDGTREIVRDYEAKYPDLIRVLYSPHNMGGDENFVLAFHACRGDYVALLEGDDYWTSPRKLQKQADFLDRHPECSMCSHRVSHVSERQTWSYVSDEQKEVSSLEDILSYNFVYTVAAMVRKEAFDDFPPWIYETGLPSDWPMWVQVAAHGHIGFVNEVLALYRESGYGEWSSLAWVTRLEAVITFYEQMRSQLGPRYERIVSSQLARYRADLARARAGVPDQSLTLVVKEGEHEPLRVTTRQWKFPEEKEGLPVAGGGSELLQVIEKAQADGADYLLFEGPVLPWLAEHRDVRRELHSRYRQLLETPDALLYELRKPVSRAAERAADVTLELTESIPDLHLGGDRVSCELSMAGARIGTLLLPVCDGVVPATVLRDAIAARFGWAIVDEFFRETVYGEVRLVDDGERASLWRGPHRLADLPYEAREWLPTGRHMTVGWTVFLQELFGRPAWPSTRFYDGRARGEAAESVDADDVIVIEASGAVPDVVARSSELLLHVTVGGGIVLRLLLRGRRRVPAEEIVATTVRGAGHELLRAAVREGVLGAPLAGASLRERLAVAARARESADPLLGALAPRASGAVVGRRPRAPIGTSVSRRAALPADAWPELLEAALLAGEQVAQVPPEGRAPACIVYAPDVVLDSAPDEPSTRLGPEEADPAPEARRHDRAHFEALHASRDAERQETAFEARRHTQMVDLLPTARLRTALEIGCGEGRLSARLAGRVDSLVATDLSQVALDRARARCAGLPNVEFARLDLLEDALPGPVHLAVCRDVLRYVGAEKLDATARKLAATLRPGGQLLIAYEDGAAAGVEEALAAAGLVLAGEVTSTRDRVQLFERPRRFSRGRALAGARSSAERAPATEAPRPGEPRLPILMYGSAHLPGRLEEQLAYLEDAGYRTAELEEWRLALGRGRPLAGRRVVLTFDGAHAAFTSDAWPSLKRYGLAALLFVRVEEIGAEGMLDWDDLRALVDEGLTLGSQGMTARSLPGLTTVEIVREAARSRAFLLRESGQPVGAFGYPAGELDERVSHLVGACGYTYGLTLAGTACTARDGLLELPRIAIAAETTFEQFVRSLS
jgi:peptidoglycan/xylan/chitin deacetylase (PgdA/CDA1 family)/2-polyprenyl-3-methyl-5-hydroxy-6-metoxy-1,4-benzoquinol methylase